MYNLKNYILRFKKSGCFRVFCFRINIELCNSLLQLTTLDRYFATGGRPEEEVGKICNASIEVE